MTPSRHHGPLPLRAAAAAMVLALAVLLPSGVAVARAKAPQKCASSDLRYPFMPGGPKSFGVFNLRITGGSCRTAHAVAKRWMTTFEASLRAGKLKLPHTISGFTFTTLPAKAAQTYSERGRKGSTTMWFDYRVPNG